MQLRWVLRIRVASTVARLQRRLIWESGSVARIAATNGMPFAGAARDLLSGQATRLAGGGAGGTRRARRLGLWRIIASLAVQRPRATSRAPLLRSTRRRHGARWSSEFRQITRASDRRAPSAWLRQPDRRRAAGVHCGALLGVLSMVNAPPCRARSLRLIAKPKRIPAEFASDRAVRLLERLAEQSQRRRADADPGVADDQRHCLVRVFDANGTLAPTERRELHRHWTKG